MQSIETVRKEGLDKFYTVPQIAEHCLTVVGNYYSWLDWNVVVEPSAGNGSFLIRIPTDKRIGLDISPQHQDVIEQDFFTYKPEVSEKILVVGNPPFGKISSNAIKFFNHASLWASTIAFILPRTFRRVSVQNKLNLNFHLEHDEDIPTDPCSFEPEMKVKCCFQIWTKRDNKREKIELETTHEDWEFVNLGPKDEKGQPTPPTTADFAIRAYGGRCGEIRSENLEKLRPKSWHWIRSHVDKNVLMERFEQLDYSLSENTARQNSIGRGELVRLYSEFRG